MIASSQSRLSNQFFVLCTAASPFFASWRRQWVIPVGVSKPSRDKRHEAFASPEQINLILRNR